MSRYSGQEKIRPEYNSRKQEDRNKNTINKY